jgi:hypothetical protein
MDRRSEQRGAGWRYEAAGRAIIKVYDEDGVFVAIL